MSPSFMCNTTVACEIFFEGPALIIYCPDRWWGSADGRDGYDAIEYLAELPWCNGSASLVGNSWLAISQWFIAAERPPHLKCIAPLEGGSDFYRDSMARGGIPSLGFPSLIQNGMTGKFGH